MSFIPLFSASCLSVEYNSHQHCLCLTLHSQLGLVALPPGTLAEPRLRTAATHPLLCLVQDNMPVAGTQTIDWLVEYLLPSLQGAGVRHWAWVCGPALRSCQLAEQVARRLPQLKLTIFDDLEHATAWLQRAR